MFDFAQGWFLGLVVQLFSVPNLELLGCTFKCPPEELELSGVELSRYVNELCVELLLRSKVVHTERVFKDEFSTPVLLA